jgi:hypothetical protein
MLSSQPNVRQITSTLGFDLCHDFRTRQPIGVDLDSQAGTSGDFERSVLDDEIRRVSASRLLGLAPGILHVGTRVGRARGEL